MACKYPNVVVRLPGFRESGKPNSIFLGGALKFFADKKMSARVSRENVKIVQCGQCTPCRLEKSRQMACRVMHETKFHECNSFLTLTYSDENVPKSGSLVRSHIQSFFKKLRSRLDYEDLGKLKFVYVGEYGEKTKRPHYHAILFGGPFAREQGNPEEPARSGGLQWSSSLISEVWPEGLHRISEVTFESAAYVARYALKKVTGVRAALHYGDRVPEFFQPSNGIGKKWFEEWKEDSYPQGTVVFPGRGEFRAPLYYDRLLEMENPELLFQTREAREKSLKVFDTVEDYLRDAERRYREGVVAGLRAKACLKREGVK